MMRMFASLLLWLTGCIAVLAQQPIQGFMADSLNIYFMQDSVRIDMDYAGNRARWEAFERAFQSRFGDKPPSALRLDIYSGASPEGRTDYNRWLGENRGNAVRQLISLRFGQRIPHIIVHNEGARWHQLYQMVAASREPWRDEVLRIIEMPASFDDSKQDHRELKLRALHDGLVWPILVERYLKPLRSGASAILSWEGGGHPDTVVVRHYIEKYDTVFVVGAGAVPAPVDMKKRAREERRDSIRYELLQYPSWAVKTNLLLWGLVAPNVSCEIPLGRSNRWSLEAEYFITWLTWSRNAHASQAQNWGVELRYWLGKRQWNPWLHGWHVGLAVGAGYYDLEWKKHEGYQGEYLNTYVNIGYQHRWGMHWGLDFSVGLGALFTKYRHYYGSSVYPQNHLEEQDDHLIWHDNDRRTWLGPCHAAVSLAYFFDAWPFHTTPKKRTHEE